MKEILSIFMVGLIVALGKLLLSQNKITIRVMVGRFIMGGALGLLGYPAIWVIGSWIPVPAAMELQIIVGLAAAFSALGTEILEKVLDAFVTKFTGKSIKERG